MDSVEKLGNMLFGKDGIAKNIRLYPGKNADATPNQVADEVLRVIERVKEGKFTVVD